MNAEMVKKLDFALSDLSGNGGLLDAEQSNQFITDLLDAPTLLGQVRSVPMSSPSMKVNKIGFGNRILKAAAQAGGFNDDGSNDRHLIEDDRSKPATSQIQLDTNEVIAEVHLHDEVLEDNIARGNLRDVVLSMIAERVALDLEEFIVDADDASGDAFLALDNGLIKRAADHVVDHASATVNADLFNNMKKSIPTQYRRNLGAMRLLVHPDMESDYRLLVSQRGTGLGDAILTGNTPLPVLGMPMLPVAMMPTDKAILMDPNNFLFGIQRDIRLEYDRDIRARTWIIVVTARVALQIEETDAVAKAINIGS